jgi:hypothetical protein
MFSEKRGLDEDARNSFSMHSGGGRFGQEKDYSVIREKFISDCEHVPG